MPRLACINDYKNGGAHDVLTLVVIYSALVGFTVLTEEPLPP